MTKGRFEEVRKKLVEMRQNLIRESQVEMGQLLKEGDKYQGISEEGDLAEISINDAMKTSQLTRLRGRLKVIDEAIYKIDQDLYGMCEECGQEIPSARLKAMPFALRCVECQERQEIMDSGEGFAASMPVPGETEKED